MNRRKFFLKSAGLLSGAFFSFNSFSKAMAFEKPFENCSQKRLFFVDSLTSSNSIAYKAAQYLNIPATARNVFIDNVRNTTAILKQLYKLISHAVKYGCALGIGHPYHETVQAVKCFFNHINNFDVLPVYVSEILE